MGKKFVFHYGYYRNKRGQTTTFLQSENLTGSRSDKRSEIALNTFASADAFLSHLKPLSTLRFLNQNPDFKKIVERAFTGTTGTVAKGTRKKRNRRKTTYAGADGFRDIMKVRNARTTASKSIMDLTIDDF